MISDKERAKVRQRIARAIEHSIPRELTLLVDEITFGWEAAHKHAVHSRLLKYARTYYSAYDEIGPDKDVK